MLLFSALRNRSVQQFQFQWLYRVRNVETTIRLGGRRMEQTQRFRTPGAEKPPGWRLERLDAQLSGAANKLHSDGLVVVPYGRLALSPHLG